MTGKLAGVVGWPVAQSLSPTIHGYWLRQHRIPGAYVALPVVPENFERCISALPLMGFAGVNVTVPHKLAAAQIAAKLDDDATSTGAVNLLVFCNGTLGSNTDVQGFANSLRESFPVPALALRPAIVIGAGGAARAILLALVRAGFRQIRIVNRTQDRAKELAGRYSGSCDCRAVAWGDWPVAFTDAGLLVNTTSLGMTGKPPLNLPIDQLPASAAVADIVYNPIRTPLLQAAEKAGHPVMDGLGMLMHQAVPAFEAWFGVRPAVTAELRAKLLKALLHA